MRASLIAALLAGMAQAQAAEVPLAPVAGGAPAVSLTLYADGAALVVERREGDVPAGASRLALTGVSPRLVPTSVLLSLPKGMALGALHYDFAVLTPRSLLERSVGKTVEVARTNPATGADIVETATIVAANDGVVLRFGDRFETELPGRLRFRELPEGLRPTPTLTAAVTAETAGRREVELRYLADGLSWQADYVLLLDANGERLDLKGRATIANTSGAGFADAAVALVAGRLHRAGPDRPLARAAQPKAAAQPMMAEMGAPEALDAFYLYRLPGPVTLADQETQQRPLLAADGLAVRREFVSESAPAVFGARSSPGGPSHPRVVLAFDNAAKSGDGAALPLPAGVARVFTRDAQGGPRLIGEDHIPDTPANAPVTLSPGLAFDLLVERTQTEFRREGLPEDSFESAWSIEARNASDRPATVRVVERLPGDWQILGESVASRKTGADRAEWSLPVPAKGTATLTYRVRVRR